MQRVLLWGAGGDFSKYLNLVRYFELKEDICVVGVTANEEIYKVIYGYIFYKKTSLSHVKYDAIIVMSDLAFEEIEREIREMKIYVPLISCSVLSIPNFNFEKYIRIKENIPTIFSCNCWGGLIYHRLKLPFKSPFINLFVKDEDYLRFLYKPEFYIDKELKWGHMAYDKYLNKEYPVGVCDDVEIHFNHYESFDAAKADWERRKERICWNNIFIMMYTEDEVIAECFSQLPYEHKVCFVPFDLKLQGVCSIPCEGKKDIYFFELVNGVVSGRYHYYDILDILSGEMVKNSELY